MNQLITYEEAAVFPKNSPSLAPRPNFTKILALHKHITQALMQLDSPQSLIYGWAGLAMDPTMYLLIELTPFTAPPDLGDLPNYPHFATPQVIKTLDQLWENARNYYLLYINISRVWFCMLGKNFNDHFKVSNDPNMIRWNPTMSIQLILAQLEASYGKPGNHLMWNNDKLCIADFPKQYFGIVVSSRGTVSRGCNHCVQPVHTNAINCKHLASSPPVQDLPNERV
jgi:hypothetical protein